MQIPDKKEHFISIGDMPSFDVSTPILDVYQKLAEAKRGGFILNDGEKQVFVKAGDLATKTMIGSPPAVRKMVAELQQTIGDLCKTPGLGPAIIPLEEDSVKIEDDPTPLQNVPEDKVYAVTSGDASVGYFLNHESVADPATKRLYFVCGNNHRNSDPDHGYCYSCPAKIVRIEQE